MQGSNSHKLRLRRKQLAVSALSEAKDGERAFLGRYLEQRPEIYQMFRSARGGQKGDIQ
jgi:hypothetical protein